VNGDERFIWNWDWSLEALSDRFLAPVYTEEIVSSRRKQKKKDIKEFRSASIHDFKQHILKVSGGNVTFTFL